MISRVTLVAFITFGTALWVTMSALTQLDSAGVQEVTGLLGSDDPSLRRTALREIWRSESLQANEAIRLALINELDRVNKERLDRYARYFKGEGVGLPDDSVVDIEYGLDVLSLVAQLDDPRAIPILVEATATGDLAARAVAGWGDRALPAVTATWRARETRRELGVPPLRFGLLLTVRRMVELETVRTDEGRSEVLAMAREALQTPDDAIMLESAVELAVLLRDPNLLAEVEFIASNYSEVVRRGVLDPESAERIQRIAKESLARVR